MMSSSPNITTPVNRGWVGMRLVGAMGARCRHVGNGPKAPAGRFWPMPPRRPLMGGEEGAGHFAGVLAPAAESYALGNMTAIKGGHEE